MSYVWVWVSWLAERNPKSGKYRLTRFVWLTVRDHRKGAKIILKLLFLSWQRVLIKTKELYPTKKICENYILLWVHWLADYTPKFAWDHLSNPRGLTETSIREVSKIVFIWLTQTRKQLLRRNQRALSNIEKLRKCVKFYSGYTGWQGTPQNVLRITEPNFVGWLQGRSENEQKLF